MRMDNLVLKSTFLTSYGNEKIDSFKMLVNGPDHISTFISNGKHADGTKRNCGIRISRVQRDQMIKWLLQHQKEYPA